jgi:hypothetical protein
MEWFWWVFVFFMAGGFAKVADAGRLAMRNRHERALERLAVEEKQRQAVEAANRPPEPVCGCTHHLAKHDKQGKCHEVVEVPTAWDSDKKPLNYQPGQCNCQQYVGPQPLSQVYAEPLTDL